MTNVFALLRLLPMSDRDKDVEILALRLAEAGIEVVLSGVQMPRMNAVMERWVQTWRRELLDRTLIWNQRHLLHALREFEQFYNAHRPHQGIGNARPLNALPPPIPLADVDARLHVQRRDRLVAGVALDQAAHADHRLGLGRTRGCLADAVHLAP
jgi:putative transposase